jgi:chromosome partitioning protein
VTDDGSALLGALQKTASLPVLDTSAPGVQLVPSGPRLSEAGQRFSLTMGADLLARCLKRTPSDWHWVIIDCPPSMGVLTVSALRASHRALFPVEASYLALSGVVQMVEALRSMRSQIPDLEMVGVIPCRAHPRRRVHARVMAELEHMFPGKVSPVVRENASLAEALGSGQPVIRFAPRSHGAEDYREVAAWLRARSV